jgi:hypothetical protein
MRRFALGVLALVLLAPLASACSLGPREDWANAMRDAHEVAADDGGATVKQSVAIKVIETNIRQEQLPLVDRSVGTVDFAAKRAQLTGTGARKTKLVYDDLVVFGSRSKGNPDGNAKPWARFDYGREPTSDIDDNDRRMAVGAGLISPYIALEVLQGVLTGSIDEVGTGMKAGVQTTRYRARLAPDAAITDIEDEDRQEGVDRMFATLGVQQADFPVDVWLDDQERVRGVRFVMRQQKDRVNAFTMTVSWEFSDYGDVDAISPPRQDQAVQQGRFREFVTELIREFG